MGLVLAAARVNRGVTFMSGPRSRFSQQGQTTGRHILAAHPRLLQAPKVRLGGRHILCRSSTPSQAVSSGFSLSMTGTNDETREPFAEATNGLTERRRSRPTERGVATPHRF